QVRALEANSGHEPELAEVQRVHQVTRGNQLERIEIVWVRIEMRCRNIQREIVGIGVEERINSVVIGYRPQSVAAHVVVRICECSKELSHVELAIRIPLRLVGVLVFVNVANPCAKLEKALVRTPLISLANIRRSQQIDLRRFSR